MFRSRSSAMDDARLMLELDAKEEGVEAGSVLLCHGPPNCFADHSAGVISCEWCFRVCATDTRPSEMIIDEIDKMTARQ